MNKCIGFTPFRVVLAVVKGWHHWCYSDSRLGTPKLALAKENDGVVFHFLPLLLNHLIATTSGKPAAEKGFEKDPVLSLQLGGEF